ncbi:hypothetical protein [Brevundimonas sp. SH203]|uniref:hypothetical protein n=1 Tax=Brevundimonas sp. SH203 TaxID=345167 RepID=UPI00190EAF6D|nr:hypothetical protein [Brevundimonas sp. SH203]
MGRMNRERVRRHRRNGDFETAPALGPRDKPEDDDHQLLSLEIAMRPDVEAMKADIEQSVALLRRRL